MSIIPTPTPQDQSSHWLSPLRSCAAAVFTAACLSFVACDPADEDFTEEDATNHDFVDGDVSQRSRIDDGPPTGLASANRDDLPADQLRAAQGEEAIDAAIEYAAEGAETDEAATRSARASFRAYKSQRGSTVPVPLATITTLCGDFDGCTLRMGMYNWDNTKRVASRSSLFYYNASNRVWRAETADLAGQDQNGLTEHVMQAWSCYLTDGHYWNWGNFGDPSVGFGLLSWSQFNAECWLTIVD
ncbi:MAG: hypothetical protein V3V08_02410 [Nannocystaceae bacterium]